MNDVRRSFDAPRSRRAPARLLLVCSLVVAALAAPRSARAAFHLWDIVEVFSNADGSIQYIELFTSSSGQQFLTGHSITATSTTSGVPTMRTFDFTFDLTGGSTANERFLIATPGFANLPGARVPDYVLPCGPFFDPDADTIVIDFAGWDSVAFTGAQLPSDGANAIDRTDASIPNSPQPFLDSAGSLTLTVCQVSGSCDACDDGDFCNGTESCSGSACGASNPCPGEMCDETMDACVECLDVGDCSDGNPCTDDECNAGTCANPDNAGPCDDGDFCTATDTCSAGSCSGAGDPCGGGDMCSETLDACVECLAPSDCADGTFCNGAETCTLGTCGAGNSPCVGDELCDEAGEACVECFDAGDCDDDNPCTDDTCPANGCVHVNNSAGCDDGLFCTGTEACLAGSCTGEGNPCAVGETCDDVLDACRFGCGDAIVAGAEDCDDGDQASGDGCDASCDLELGYACTTAGNTSVCDVVFGDGLVVGDEACDDGNQASGDGCSEGTVEAGFACNGATPNVCTEESTDAGIDTGDDAGAELGDAAAPGSAADAAVFPRADGGGPIGPSLDGGGRPDANDSDDAPSSGGCDCRAASPSSPTSALPWLLALAVLLRRGRRKRTEHRRSSRSC